ncbi:hypothetical protein BT69DRAFT_1283028 [Atractiella rhizophila]|nr:hypothetical protein BT69DRAFT_1283028 [Atractiella rhizophila]
MVWERGSVGRIMLKSKKYLTRIDFLGKRFWDCGGSNTELKFPTHDVFYQVVGTNFVATLMSRSLAIVPKSGKPTSMV